MGTALYLQHIGFEALATTSAGFAFSRGKPDGRVALDEMLAHIGEVVAATPLPVNADFLNGFADEPEDISTNVKLCIATGVAGLSIEDNSGNSAAPLYEKNLAVDRIRAFVEKMPAAPRTDGPAVRLNWCGHIESPILGGEGNKEFLACLRVTSA